MEPTPAGSRNLGSISAEFDRRFQQHFVETPEFGRLLTDDCLIVAGAKGSGKTALMRALADIDTYRSRYCAVYGVKLDGLKFAQLNEAMKRLDTASRQGIVAIARTTWQNVIAIFALEAALENNLVGRRERGHIRKYLLNNHYLDTAPSDKLLGHLERIWQLIAKLSKEEDVSEAEPLLGLHARQQHAVAAFPSDPRLSEYLAWTTDAIRGCGKRLLICLDGLDSVVEYTLESRDVVFAGLIDAAYKSATHPKLEGVMVKALIPKELAHGARTLLRDLDKIDQYMASIHWDADNLGLFIKRRLEEHVKAKGRTFEEVWREFFPEKLKNDVHNLDEDSYHYLLRHTLYRPRQLLIHVQNILNEWDSRSVHTPFRVDPTFIPKVVAETNHGLAEYVVNELLLDFPRLSELLKSFRGLPSVMVWSELAGRIERYLGVPLERVGAVFTDLYNYGIFGVSNAAAPTEGSRKAPTHFAFGFMTRRVERNIAGGLRDGSLVAIAPMFAEYCGCKPSSVGVISPCP